MCFEVNRLTLTLGTETLLQDVSLSIKPNEAIGLIGRSGCGKSTLAKTLVGLHPSAPGALKINGNPFNPIFGKVGHTIQYMWQDPHMALSPFLTALKLVEEALEGRGDLDRTQKKAETRDLLRQVGITPDLSTKRPHSLSGGQCQRIALARAIAAKPEYLILDEPFSALDLVTQKNIISLIKDFRKAHSFGLMIISHDLRTLRHLADRMVLMDQGRIIENSPTEVFLNSPQHPLSKEFSTQALAEI